MLMDILIYAGSALMVYNILRYFGFIKRMKWMSTSPRNRLVLFTPQVLLILFLIGYLFVGIFCCRRRWYGRASVG